MAFACTHKNVENKLFGFLRNVKFKYLYNFSAHTLKYYTVMTQIIEKKYKVAPFDINPLLAINLSSVTFLV